MARVPDTSGDGEVAERIRSRRGGALRPIDTVLLHSPRLADGWNGLLGVLRGGTSLPADLREIVVLRIAVLNDAPYEWESHLQASAEAGLSSTHLEAIRLDDPTSTGALTAIQALVVELTDTMTREVVVPDALFARLSTTFDTAAVVELVTTVAAYNMVSRLVVALAVTSPVTAGAA